VTYQNKKKIVKHVLTNAIIGDAIGADLDKIPPTSRGKQYIGTVRQTKSRFPGEGIPTQNSSVLYHAFKFLIEKKPTPSQLKVLKPNFKGTTDENIVLGTSLALGLYCSLSDLDQDDLIKMVNSAITAFGVTKHDCSVYYYLAITAYQLINDGYLRPQHFDDLSRLNLVSGNLLTALSWLNVYAFCRITYTDVPVELLSPLTYSERITVMSLYYLFQSFSGYGKKPRFAVEDFVGNTPALGTADLLFVYSALCTASEHQYLLFTKPLQEKMRYHTELCLLMKP
jgi:hypothetical protein